MIIDISKADRAEVLMQLFNHCHNISGGHNPLVGLIQAQLPKKDIEWARRILEVCDRRKYYYFDYLEGRSMKIDLEGPIVDTRLYDRDCGNGAAERALKGVPGVEFHPVTAFI